MENIKEVKCNILSIIVMYVSICVANISMSTKRVNTVAQKLFYLSEKGFQRSQSKVLKANNKKKTLKPVLSRLSFQLKLVAIYILFFKYHFY